MSGIDLQSFCGDDLSWQYLNAPFKQDNFTFATNGHILVRVALRDSDPDLPKGALENINNVILKGVEDAIFSPPPPYTLPPESAFASTRCLSCAGTGRDHECPSCDCDCIDCDGTGTWPTRVSTTLGAVDFDLTYVRKVLALPGVELAEAKPDEPLLFRFSGGVGALMPLRRKQDNHVEIFESAPS